MFSAEHTPRRVAAAGLPRGRCARIGIVGAGIAGLVAAHELRRAGHEVIVLEARSRVGGRIHTLRAPFTHGLYAEAGAMRVPASHHLTRGYIERFGLPTRPFVSHHPQTLRRIHGTRLRAEELGAQDLGFGLSESDTQRLRDGADTALFSAAAAQLRDDSGAHAARLDRLSIRAFLAGAGWSSAAIERFGILSGHESLLESSVLEFLRGRNDTDEMLTIPGGMSRLPEALAEGLDGAIHLGAVLRAVEQDGEGVRLHTHGLYGARTVSCDLALVTVPLSVLRHIEFSPLLSPPMERALRQAHYDSAGKIFLQFRERFWEAEGIHGGTSITTSAIRHVVYPGDWSDGRPTRRGVLLASYTWAQDALRWSSLPPAERLQQALEDLELLHPGARRHVEVGASYFWSQDPFAGGAFMVCQPGQLGALHEDICREEGRVYFAGEHASLKHRWIEGAVESALREAARMHARAQQLTPPR